jgi:hypothetical protein
MFISDTVIDEDEGFDYPQDGSDDWLLGLVEEAVNSIFCNAYGHDIVDDHCGIPAHRYCIYCGRREGQIKGV